jgi:uncharacterized repeat protein (TIGR03987 family)
MLLAVLSISGALVLYTLAIWSEQICGNLRKWMLLVFVSGFTFDLLGTTQMYFLATEKVVTFHSLAGYLALLIMCLHLFWALFAFNKGKENIRYINYFHQGSKYAWLVWLIAFFSGIPWK